MPRLPKKTAGKVATRARPVGGKLVAARSFLTVRTSMAEKVVDRERTLNDITNTGVTAALIGGARVRAWAGAQHALSPLAVPNGRICAEQPADHWS